ncbi:MAG: diaminopimelate epimerase [Lachnospiraceae bacterium]
MSFTKMHGCGNDYIYINGFTTSIEQKKKEEIIKKISDRHFGIGSDGVIFINPSKEADFEMEMYNADGSRGEMCGNGIRCVAKYVYDFGLTSSPNISIISAGAIKYLTLSITEGKVESVRVNMGKPILYPKDIPVISEHDSIVHEPIIVGEKEYFMTCVSMGNPHTVVFVDDVSDLDLEKIGPMFEHHKLFPNRINTEFVQVIDETHVKMRVWERGSGETLACGTGCCATAVACILNGYTKEKMEVEVLGGKLFIEWDKEENLVYMTGPATTVFQGEITV